MRRLFRRQKPDVLHFNDSHAVTAGGIASWGLHVPARISSRRVTFDLRSARQYRLLCDRVICVSEAVARICEQSGVAAPRLNVVHDGVCPEPLARTARCDDLPLPANRRVLLCVASLCPEKGHEHLLAAMPRILGHAPDVQLVLAGAGELAGALQRQAEQLGIAERVSFLGFRHDVRRILSAADLFVMPSLREGFCSVLVQAMLAGLPIVASDVGGIPEALGASDRDPDPVGWLVPPANPQRLAQAIVDALSSPHKAAAFSAQARQRALTRFTADRMVEATLDVYWQTISSKSSNNVVRRPSGIVPSSANFESLVLAE
jgi:glycosyltransferase involved in cell wall biosynthesis